MTKMDHSEITEALGQIAPGDARAVAIEHRIDKQTVIRGWPTDVTRSAGQQVFDQFPLRICEGVSACHAPDNGASAEFDDTP